MKRKNKNILKLFSKITILGVFFASLFAVSHHFLGEQTTTASNTNRVLYKKVDKKDIISHVGVALGTNIGTSTYKNKNQKSSTRSGYSNTSSMSDTRVLGVENILKNPETAHEEIIEKNMIFVREYFSLLKGDFKNILGKSANKGGTLKNITSQLELRYTGAVKNMNTLTEQGEKIQSYLINQNQKIEKIKLDIDTAFPKGDLQTIQQKNKEYLILKKDYIEARMYLIYINNFLRQYRILNTYNAQLLDVFINNKDIISKESYLVIPDTGASMLKDLGLVFDESEHKNK